MVKHPTIRIWIKQRLLNQIEGLYFEHLLRRHDNNLVSTIAAAGFKDTTPFFEALGHEEFEETTAKRNSLVSPLVADMTFNTLVQTSSYLAAVELLLRVCRDSPFKSNFSFIYGREGHGKTHLLNATDHEIRRFHPERNTALVNMLDLTIALMRATRRGISNDFVGFLSQIDTLLIDDVQFCVANSQAQADLLEVIEKQLEQAQHRLIFSCDVKPSELQLSESRLKSAMEKMTIAELTPPDKAEREQMVLKFAGGVELPAEVRNYLAENITENIRELKAAVIQLIAVARSMSKETWLEVTKDIVSPARINAPQKPEIVSGEFKVMADKTARGTNHHPQLLKEIIRLAESNAEDALSHQIALSQIIERLSYDKSAANRPLIAGLQLALQAIREGDLATASKFMQSYGLDSKQRPDPSIAVLGRGSDSKLPRHQMG